MSYFPKQNTWEENYKKIINLGKKLPKFNQEGKQEKWLIRACQSPLWLKAEIQPSGKLLFTGDSEGLISKGLLALILEFYNERAPSEILKAKPLFIEELDLGQYLTIRRANGLQALLDQILQYAKAFLMLKAKK